MKIQAPLILWVLVALPVAAEEPPDRSYLHAATGLEFPSTLGAMQIVSIANYEEKDPGLGTGLRYDDRESVKADVYIYNLGLKEIPAGTESPEMIRHLQQCENEIRAMEKLGRYQSVQEISRETVPLGGEASAPRARWVFYSFKQDGVERLSHIYLTSYRNHFFKIRCTYPKADESHAKSVLDGFLSELGKILIRADSSPVKP